MKKSFKIITVFLLNVIMLFGVMSFSACGNTPREYNVNVACGNPAVLEGVKVQLVALDGTIAAEQSLKDGKAVFQIDAACYIVSLAGVGGAYSYDAKLLTESKRTAEINIVEAKEEDGEKLLTYTVFAVSEKGKPIEGVFVQLCDVADTDGAGCRPDVTDADGSAVYELAQANYHVVVLRCPDGYSNDGYKDENNKICTVSATQRYTVITLKSV